MTKILYGQIGVGHAHASKIAVYRDSPEYEVVGVVEEDPELRRQAQARPEYQGLQWMGTEQLLNFPGLQVVGVETNVDRLLKTASQCIAAEKHIHLDKPAGESLPTFRKLLDHAARKHLVIQMGYMYRHNPAIVMLREFLRKGWLGEPFEVHAVMSKRLDVEARRHLTQYDGGTMFELGCHLIDLVLGVMDAPEKIHAFPRHSSLIPDGLNDNMLAVFEYERATATIRSSVNEVDGFARRHFVVCGSEGTFHIQPLDRPRATIALSRRRGHHPTQTHVQAFEPYRRYVADAADLAKIVRHEKDSDYSYEHDFQVQKAVLAASALEPTGYVSP